MADKLTAVERTFQTWLLWSMERHQANQQERTIMECGMVFHNFRNAGGIGTPHLFSKFVFLTWADIGVSAGRRVYACDIAATDLDGEDCSDFANAEKISYSTMQTGSSVRVDESVLRESTGHLLSTVARLRFGQTHDESQPLCVLLTRFSGSHLVIERGLRSELFAV